MAEIYTITIEMCRKFLRYDSESGKLYWNLRDSSDFRESPHKSRESIALSWNKSNAGKEAFTSVTNNRNSSANGYKFGSFNYRPISAHRVIWAMVHGYWPVNVDHIDGDRSNNRIENLREVSKRENTINRRIGRKNTSGQMGVDFNKNRGKWRARIKDNGREIALGHFDSKELAIAARKAAEIEYGYHPNHGAEKPDYSGEFTKVELFLMEYPDMDKDTAQKFFWWLNHPARLPRQEK